MATVTKPTASQQQATLRGQEQLFSNVVGGQTGLDPRVIFSQIQAEGAYAPGGTGGLNFLNLKSSTVSSLGKSFAGSSPAGFAQFANLGQAEQATIAEFQSPSIKPFISPPAGSPQGQIEQIGASPWDQTHYGGGGSSLAADFSNLYGGAALTSPAIKVPGNTLYTPSGNVAPLAGSTLSGIQTGVNAVTGAVTGPISSVSGALSWITNTKNLQRLGEIVGGSVLIAIGLVMVGRAASNASPVKQTTAAAQTVAAPVGAVRQRRAREVARQPISRQPRAAQRRAGFTPADTPPRRPRRGQPGSSRLSQGDSIPF